MVNSDYTLLGVAGPETDNSRNSDHRCPFRTVDYSSIILPAPVVRVTKALLAAPRLLVRGWLQEYVESDMHLCLDALCCT